MKIVVTWVAVMLGVAEVEVMKIVVVLFAVPI